MLTKILFRLLISAAAFGSQVWAANSLEDSIRPLLPSLLSANLDSSIKDLSENLRGLEFEEKQATPVTRERLFLFQSKFSIFMFYLQREGIPPNQQAQILFKFAEVTREVVPVSAAQLGRDLQSKEMLKRLSRFLRANKDVQPLLPYDPTATEKVFAVAKTTVGAVGTAVLTPIAVLALPAVILGPLFNDGQMVSPPMQGEDVVSIMMWPMNSYQFAVDNYERLLGHMPVSSTVNLIRPGSNLNTRMCEALLGKVGALD